MLNRHFVVLCSYFLVGNTFVLLTDASLGPLVTTKQGAVRGESVEVLGQQVDVFLGLPFAKPPVGDLRFKSPVTQIDSWQGERNGTFFRPSCVQNMAAQNIPGDSSEDCLYLNVYAPANVTSKPIPVLVWIYGGGLSSGSATIYDGTTLSAQGQIIVVTINYRLGAFGFLASDSSDVTGNAGMEDQQAALVWVKENVASFGGDPSMVTICGESSGGGAVSLHMLAPTSWNLFRRGISESGTMTGPATIRYSYGVDASIALSMQLGCENTTTKTWASILSCMRGKSSQDILAAQSAVYAAYQAQNLGMPFYVVAPSSFLPGDPLDLLSQGRFKKTDYLNGVNRNEYTLFMMPFAGKYFQVDTSGNAAMTMPVFNNLATLLLTSRTGIIASVPGPANTGMIQTAMYKYTDWRNASSGSQRLRQLIDLASDLFFNCPVPLLAKTWTSSANHAQGSKLFVYTFSKVSGIYPAWAGVPHGSEMIYLFGQPLVSSTATKEPDATGKPTGTVTFTDEDRNVSKQMIAMWSNFVKTG